MASESDEDWARYLETSPIMSNSPIRSPSARVPLVVPIRPAVWNRPVILLIAVPALWLGFIVAVGSTGSLYWWMVWATLALATVTSVMLARADERVLRTVGHERTASPWTAVLPIVYLARRGGLAWSVNSAAYRPLWIYLLVVGCVVLLVQTIPFLVALVTTLGSSRIL